MKNQHFFVFQHNILKKSNIKIVCVTKAINYYEVIIIVSSYVMKLTTHLSLYVYYT